MINARMIEAREATQAEEMAMGALYLAYSRGQTVYKVTHPYNFTSWNSAPDEAIGAYFTEPDLLTMGFVSTEVVLPLRMKGDRPPLRHSQEPAGDAQDAVADTEDPRQATG